MPGPKEGDVEKRPPRTGDDLGASLGELVGALDWRADRRAIGDARVGCLAWLYRACRDLVGRAVAARVPGAERTAEAIEALPERARARLFVAPETAYRVIARWSDVRSLLWLGEAAEAELAILGTPASEPRWTALGDRYLPAGVSGADLESGGVDAAGIDAAAEFDPTRPYAAPTLGSIVVDYVSPQALAVRGPNGFVDGAPSCAAARTALRKLRAAEHLIAGVGEGVASFVDRGIATLVLRSERASGAIGSSSMPEYLGRAVCWNADLPAADIGELAGQLVHEAIHGHAYRLELDAPFVVESDGALDRLRVTSPWSGRALPVHSYLHACFVWYGLASFWLAVVERQHAPPETAFPHLVRAARGFAVDLVDRLGGARVAVAPPVLETIAFMERSMRAASARSGWLASALCDTASGTA
jgi:HEXXH motif-containing protein